MKNLWRAGLLALALPQAAWAGWASLGTMPAPQRDGPKLTWKSPQGVLSLSVLSPEVVRVRFVPQPEFGRDHSYAVAGKRASTWAVMARADSDLAPWRSRPSWQPAVRQDHVALWTDDFSNLLSIFMWR